SVASKLHCATSYGSLRVKKSPQRLHGISKKRAIMSRSIRLIRLLVLIAAILFAKTADAQQGKWLRKAPFPEPSEELLGAAAGGKLYVFAGLAPGWKPKALVYQYDPTSDKWAQRNPMPLPSHHVGIVEFQGKIYAFGGFVMPQAGPPAWEPINNA